MRELPTVADRHMGGPRRQRATWVYAFSLALWAAGYNLDRSVLLSWSPVPPVWVGGFAVALCTVHRLGRGLQVSPRTWAPLALLLLAFLPGAVLSGATGDGATSQGFGKVVFLLLVMLPIVLAALVLLDTPVARARWMWVQVGTGLAVAVAAAEFNDVSAIAQVGRFTLARVDTISSGRLVGAAVTGLLVVALASRRARWWALLPALGCGMVLVQIGSRGPLLSAVTVTLVIGLVAHCFAGRRRWPLAAGALASAAAFAYARAGAGGGGTRIVESVQEGLRDDVRERLLRESYELGMTHTFGIGWGNFADFSPTGRAIANSEGVSYAHNVFAETFAEGGVVALLGFTALAGLALYRLRQASGDAAGAAVLAMALYWLLNAQVSSDLAGNRYLWIAIACGLAAKPPVSGALTQSRAVAAKQR